jgi:hypothetical protein
MGTCYYQRCLDCKAFVDLDKFYTYAVIDGTDWAEIAGADRQEGEGYDGIAWRALRLMKFLSLHNGHRLDMVSEHDFEALDRDDWREDGPITTALVEGKSETIRFDDPCARRLEVVTRLGTIYIDDRGADINVWFSRPGPAPEVQSFDGQRFDIKAFTAPRAAPASASSPDC